MKALIYTGIIASAAAAAVVVVRQSDPRKPLIQQMDNYYQELFADLELAFRGDVGVSRMLKTALRHDPFRPELAKKFDSDRYEATVEVFGDKTTPPRPDTIKSSVSAIATRNPSGLVRMNSAVSAPNTKDLARDALEQAQSGDFTPVIRRSGQIISEARFIRLSKEGCLKCHSGMKLDDPVAVIVYTTRPLERR